MAQPSPTPPAKVARRRGRRAKPYVVRSHAETILRVVATHYGYNHAMLTSASVGRAKLARDVAIYLAHKVGHASVKVISRKLVYRKVEVVRAAIRRVVELRYTDPAVICDLDVLEPKVKAL